MCRRTLRVPKNAYVHAQLKLMTSETQYKKKYCSCIIYFNLASTLAKITLLSNLRLFVVRRFFQFYGNSFIPLSLKHCDNWMCQINLHF